VNASNPNGLTAATTTVAQMQSWVDAFTRERDWERFHTPKNLAMSIAIESAELMEQFQWTTEAVDPTNVEEELADVLSYLLRLASVMNIDIASALHAKIAKNAIKYPLPRPENGP